MRCLPPERRDDVQRLLQEADALGLSAGARLRLQWFAYALENGGSVERTCEHFGISRSTLMRWAKRFDPLDPRTLEERSRCPHTLREPETDPKVIDLIRRCREERPLMGKEKIQKWLREKHGVCLSVSTVGRVIVRHAFFFADIPSHRAKRLRATVRSAEERDVARALTEGTIAAAPEILAAKAAVAEAAPRHAEQPGAVLRDTSSFHSDAPQDDNPALPLSLFLLATSIALSSFLGAAPRTQAAESSSFKLYDEFPNYAERGPGESASFKLNEDGITWESKPLQSSSFRIVTAPPVTAAEVSPPPPPPAPTPAPAPPPSGGCRRGTPGCPLPPPAPPAPPAAPPPPPGAVPPPGVVVPPPPVTPPPTPPPHRAAPPPPVLFEFPDLPQSYPTLTFFGGTDPLCPACPVCEGAGAGPESDVPLGGSLIGPQTHGVRLSSFLLAAIVLLSLLLGGFLLHFLRSFAREGGGGWRKSLFFLPFFGLFEDGDDEKKRPEQKALEGQSALFGQPSSPEEPVKPRDNGARAWRWILWLLLLAGVLAVSLAISSRVFAATTAPLRHVYNGHLLDSSGNAITTAHTIRFSYWRSADYVAGDVTATGAINVGASTYVGWYETQTVTPNSQGYFTVQLGSGTALPTMDALSQSDLLSLFLQVEVKASSAADTAYELLDVNTSSDAVDRSPVLSVPFALNADMLDQRDTGTGSGNIMVLGSGAILQLSGSSVRLDVDNSEATELSLQFGGTLAKKLSFDVTNDRFNFNDDVRIQGNLDVTGLINGVDIKTLTGALRVFSGGALTIKVTGGSYRLSGNITNFAGQEGVAVTDNATNYVFFGSGGLTVRTMAFPTDESTIPLAEVVTSAGGVSTVTDRRVLQSDDRERTVLQTFHAEHQNASYQGDATNNVGRLFVSHDTSSKRNFYEWTSSMSTLQDYEIILRTTLSTDFVRWGSGSLQVSYRSTSADTANNKMDISVFDTSGVPVTLVGSSTDLASTSWAVTTLNFGGSPPTWTPGQDFLIKLKLYARSDFQMHTGDLTLKYVDLPAE